MEHQKQQKPTNESCSQCRVTMRRSTFTRHLRLHRTPITRPTPMYVVLVMVIEQQQLYSSPSNTCRSTGSNTMSVTAASITAVAAMTDALSHQYSMAAWALLKQHDRYTEEDPLEFLAMQYPCIPENHRLALIRGASAGE